MEFKINDKTEWVMVSDTGTVLGVVVKNEKGITVEPYSLLSSSELEEINEFVLKIKNLIQKSDI